MELATRRRKLSSHTSRSLPGDAAREEARDMYYEQWQEGLLSETEYNTRLAKLLVLAKEEAAELLERKS